MARCWRRWGVQFAFEAAVLILFAGFFGLLSGGVNYVLAVVISYLAFGGRDPFVLTFLIVASSALLFFSRFIKSLNSGKD
jgi:hypothetical protein